MNNLRKKIAFHTLGCKLNYTETSTMSNMLDNELFEIVKFNEFADYYIINTCTVTGNADKKSKAAIRKAIKINENSKIIVTGCYAQLNAEQLRDIPNIYKIIGNNEKLNLSEHLSDKSNEKIFSCTYNDLKDFFPAYSYGERTRSFLKIQDGCDYNCSYCTIPKARGKSRNNSISEIINQVIDIADKNIKEIILSGVNIGDFGRSTNENFLTLITELDKIDKIERFRISSIEPNLLSNEIIQFVSKSNKFVPHFHIPLQSGSDRILRLMRRRYSLDLFTERIKNIRDIIPYACIGADIITGFPDETDIDFNNSYQLLKESQINYLHVFTYSDRPGTDSSNMTNKIPGKIKNERSKMLHNLSEQLYNSFLLKNNAKRHRILFENHIEKGKISGYTENYIRVSTEYNKNLENSVIERIITVNKDTFEITIKEE